MPNLRKFLEENNALEAFKKDFNKGRNLGMDVETFLNAPTKPNSHHSPIDTAMVWANTSAGQIFWSRLDRNLARYYINNIIEE